MLKRLAHNPHLPLHGLSSNSRELSEVISSERRLVEVTQRLSAERAKSSTALKEWGIAEGPDLGDVLSKISTLFDWLSSAEMAFAEHDATYRLHFKTIRTKEEDLATLKRSRDQLQSKIESQDKKVSKMKEENKDLPASLQRLAEMRQEMIGLENSVLTEETRLGDFKRTTTREAMSLKLGAMLELAEKTVVVGELGKLMVDEIPTDTTEPGASRAAYLGYEKTDDLMGQAQKCIQDVVFNPQPLQNEYGARTGSVDYGYDGQAAYRPQQYDEAHYDEQYRRPSHDYDAQEPDAGYNHTLPPVLPELYASAPVVAAPSHLPAGARAGDPEPAHAGRTPGLLAAVQAQGPAGYDNRSSLAYMDDDGVSDVHPHDDVETREREQAEENEREERERAQHFTRYDSSGLDVDAVDQARKDSKTPVIGGAELEAATGQPPREITYSPPPPTHKAYHPSDLERPYVPREGDGAYHGPDPSAPPPPAVPSTVPAAHAPSPNALPSISTTFDSPYSGVPLPASPATPTQFTKGPATTKPSLPRGESSLGSKYGDLGPSAFATSTNNANSGSDGRGGGSFLVASGYNNYRGGDSASQSSGAGEGRKIAAGAFRRGGPLSPGAGSGPSQADAIRDLYRSRDVTVDDPSDPAPRFDVSPLQVNKARGPPQRAGTLPTQATEWRAEPPSSTTAVEGEGQLSAVESAAPPYEQQPTSPGFGSHHFVTRLD